MAAYDPSRPRPHTEERLGLSREEAESVLATRQELGDEYDAAVVDSFMERVDRTIDARVEQRLEAQIKKRPKRGAGPVVIALGSLVLAIPLSGIGAIAGLPGLILVWSAVILINLVYAVRQPS